MIYGMAPRPGGEARVCGVTDQPMLDDTIPGLLARTVAANPEGEALIFTDRGLRLTWRQFSDAVDRLATGLLNWGYRAGIASGYGRPTGPNGC